MATSYCHSTSRWQAPFPGWLTRTNCAGPCPHPESQGGRSLLFRSGLTHSRRSHPAPGRNTNRRAPITSTHWASLRLKMKTDRRRWQSRRLEYCRLFRLCCKKSRDNTMDVSLLLFLGLSCHSKQAGYGGHLPGEVSFASTSHLSLAKHVHHLIPLSCPPCRFNRKEAHQGTFQLVSQLSTWVRRNAVVELHPSHLTRCVMKR